MIMDYAHPKLLHDKYTQLIYNYCKLCALNIKKLR